MGSPGDPTVLRSTAGTLESPIGEVIAISSEHDDVAGTSRGPNTIFLFDLDEIRVAHFGDFGQSELRAEQAVALEGTELLFLPIGGGPTIGAEAAAAIVERLQPRWVVPMHYRTPRINFLETEEEFIGLMPRAERLSEERLRHLGAARGGWRARRRPGVALGRARYGRRSVASFAASASRSTILANSWKPSSVSPYCPEA